MFLVGRRWDALPRSLPRSPAPASSHSISGRNMGGAQSSAIPGGGTEGYHVLRVRIDRIMNRCKEIFYVAPFILLLRGILTIRMTVTSILPNFSLIGDRTPNPLYCSSEYETLIVLGTNSLLRLLLRCYGASCRCSIAMCEGICL